MKFDRKILKRALTEARRTIAVRSSMPILNNVSLTRKSDHLIEFWTSDLELASCTRVVCVPEFDAPLEEFYSVPLKQLAALVNRFKGDFVNISASSRDLLSVEIRCVHTQHTLSGTASEEHPTRPTKHTKYQTLPAYDLAQALALVLPAVSRDETRYNLNGVFVEAMDGYVNIIATDGHRLAKHKIQGAIEGLASVGAIIPLKFWEVLQPKLKNIDQVQISFDGQTFEACSDDWTLTTRQIEGTYPSYRQVIPKNANSKLVLRRTDWIDALQALLPSLDPRNHTVELKFGKSDTVHVSGGKDTPVSTKIKARIALDLIGVTAVFNASYLIDALKGFTCAHVTCGFVLEIDKEKKTIVLSPVLFTDEIAIGLAAVMPIRPSN